MATRERKARGARSVSPLRARLLLLVIFALAPAYILLTSLAAESRRRAVQDVQDNAVTLVRLVAANQQEGLESARRLLFALSLLREVRGADPAACAARLGEILAIYPNYVGFGVTDAAGTLWCATSNTGQPAAAAERGWFQRAMETGQFTLGDYEFSETLGRQVTLYAAPLFDPASPAQSPRAVVFAVAPKVTLAETAASVPLPAGTVIIEVDSRGVITDRYPEAGGWVGQALPEAPLVRLMLAQGEGVAAAEGLDGMTRLFAFTPAHRSLNTGHYLAAGLPQNLVTAEADRPFLHSLLWLSLAGLLSLGLAWWGSDFFILRWLRRLAQVIEQISQGDLSARAALPHGSGEMGQLGQALDHMAASLEQRAAEREAAAAALAGERERLRVTLGSIGDGVIATDAAGRVNFLNGVAEALTGWRADEAAGRPLEEVFEIVDEATGACAVNPAARALREQDTVGLAEHTLLVSKDGARIPIADSAAPIREARERILGVVLVFRDVRAQRQAQEALRQSRDELSAILAGVAEGITAQDPDGRLRFANDAAARLLGYPSAEALLAAPPAQVTENLEILDEAGNPFPLEQLPGRQALLGERNPVATVRYRNRLTGAEHWSAVKATPIFDTEGRVAQVVNIFEDITELKRAELAQRLLAEAGRLLGSSLQPASRLNDLARLAVPHLADWCAVDVLAEDEAIEHAALAHQDPAQVERAAQLRQRYPVDPAAPRGVPNVLRTGEAEFYPVIDDDLLAAGARDPGHLELLRSVGMRSVIIVPLKARGRTLGALTLVRTEGRQPYTVADLRLAEEMARRAALALDNALLYAEEQRLNADLERLVDERTAALRQSNAQLQAEVAERRAAQRSLEESREQLRRLSDYLQTAREDERTRVAREIHDELGQALAALKMDVAWLGRSIETPDPDLAAKLADMAGLIDETAGAVRRIASELRPRILDELGLPAAIEWQLGEFQNRTGLKCVLVSNVEELELDPDRAAAMFRLFQEALTNVIRHAAAAQVRVRLQQAGPQLTLEVQDDGRGLSPADLTKSRSFGLLGMKERVHLLGGTIDIRGAPGAGTTISVTISLDQDKA